MDKLISVRVPKEILEFIEHFEGKNISEKFRNYIASSVIQKNTIEFKIKEYESNIKQLKDKLKSNIFSELNELSKEEIEQIKIDKKIIKEKGETYLPGRCNLFNSKFKRGLTISDFRLLLKK